MQLQGKLKINMIWSMSKCGFLPLNMDNVFDFKLESCGSVI